MVEGEGGDEITALENPVINGPYDVPARHFVIGPKGPTGAIASDRRLSESFIPVAPVRNRAPRAKGAASMPSASLGEQLTFSLLQEIRQENKLINELRKDVANWRG